MLRQSWATVCYSSAGSFLMDKNNDVWCTSQSAQQLNLCWPLTVHLWSRGWRVHYNLLTLRRQETCLLLCSGNFWDVFVLLLWITLNLKLERLSAAGQWLCSWRPSQCVKLKRDLALHSYNTVVGGKKIKIDAAEPEILSFFLLIFIPCQNLVPALPTMQIDCWQFCWRFGCAHSA